MAEIIDLQQQQGPKFDPNKKYTWDMNAQFVLDGGDFGMLLNAMRAVINTKEAQTILLAKQAGDVLEETLAAAVEAGVVVEVPENKSSL
jgi:uncharacterized glyoxalase superfamily protein PhnB